MFRGKENLHYYVVTARLWKGGAIKNESLLFEQKELQLANKSKGLSAEIDVSIADIVDFLSKHREITVLNLNNSRIGDKEAEELFQLLQHDTSLKIISLVGNEITKEGIKALVEASYEINDKLSHIEIDLSNNDNTISREEIALQMKAAEDSKRKLMDCINILFNRDDKNIKETGEYLNQLESLDLSSENLSRNGILTSLDVSDIKLLAQILKNNTSLVTLNLSQNQINGDGAKILAEGLEQNTTLKNLDLSKNDIPYVDFSEILKRNKSLETLDIHDNGSPSNSFDEICLEAFQQAIQSNPYHNIPRHILLINTQEKQESDQPLQKMHDKINGTPPSETAERTEGILLHAINERDSRIQAMKKSSRTYIAQLESKLIPGFFHFKEEDKKDALAALWNSINTRQPLNKKYLPALTDGNLWKKVVKKHIDALPPFLREPIQDYAAKKKNKPLDTTKMLFRGR